MSALPRYTDLSTAERDRLVTEPRSAELLVARGVANVEAVYDHLPHVESRAWMSLPPAPGVLDDATAGAVYALSADDAAGAWQRLIVFVYRRGGDIAYRRHDARDVRVRISYPT